MDTMKETRDVWPTQWQTPQSQSQSRIQSISSTNVNYITANDQTQWNVQSQGTNNHSYKG